MKRSLLALSLLAATTLALANVAPPPPDAGAPSVLDDGRPLERGDGARVFWSFPRDDQSAIEVDEGDLRAGTLPSRQALLDLVTRCDKKREAKLLAEREAGGTTPMRELRVAAKAARPEKRCALPLATWRKRLGHPMVERLEDEHDAYLRYLLPGRPSPRHPPDLGSTTRGGLEPSQGSNDNDPRDPRRGS